MTKLIEPMTMVDVMNAMDTSEGGKELRSWGFTPHYERSAPGGYCWNHEGLGLYVARSDFTYDSVSASGASILSSDDEVISWTSTGASVGHVVGLMTLRNLLRRWEQARVLGIVSKPLK